MYFFLCIGIISCSTEEYFEEEIGSDKVVNDKPELRSPGVPGLDLLGYGYDVTQEYLGRETSRLMVLDLDKFKKYNKNRVDSNLVTESTIDFFYGATSSDLIKEINKKITTNVGGGGAAAANKFFGIGA